MIALLRLAAFRWLFLGRTVTSLGSAVAPIALGFAVLDLTGSLTALGLVVASRSIAQVGVLLLGGVLADRWSRHIVLAGSQLLAAVAQAVVATVVLTGAATVPLLAALGVVNGAAAGSGFPATAALVPQTVPAAVLRRANAMSRLGVVTALIGGAALGGLLVAGAGPGWGLAISAATFAVAAACFLQIKIIGGPGPVAGDSVLADLREGWTEFCSRRWVVVVVSQYFVVNACFQGSLIVLGPAVADASFGRAGWGMALATFNLGMVLGGLIAMRWQPRHALRWGVALGLVNVIPLSVLASIPNAAAVAAAFLLLGVSIEQFVVAWDVSLQENVPTDRLARVYSYDALGSFSAIPLGQALLGPLAEAFGVKPVLLGCAGLIAAATLLALASKSVRSLERRPLGEKASETLEWSQTY